MKWSETPYHWETAARLAVAAAPWAATPDDPPRVLNLNVPNVPLDELRGVREAQLARYGEVWVASADVQGGDLRMEFQGVSKAPDPDTDAALVLDGYATVTDLAGIAASPRHGAAASVLAALG
jgi:5'-nucleotidase